MWPRRLVTAGRTLSDVVGFHGCHRTRAESEPQALALARYVMNPRLVFGNAPMFGNTYGRSDSAMPNQRASVAPYCSSDVVGIQRPSLPRSSGPFSACVGTVPKKSPPFTAPPIANA